MASALYLIKHFSCALPQYIFKSRFWSVPEEETHRFRSLWQAERKTPAKRMSGGEQISDSVTDGPQNLVRGRRRVSAGWQFYNFRSLFKMALWYRLSSLFALFGVRRLSVGGLYEANKTGSEVPETVISMLLCQCCGAGLILALFWNYFSCESEHKFVRYRFLTLKSVRNAPFKM